MAGIVIVPPQTADGSPIAARPQWQFSQLPLTRQDDGTELMNINGTASGTAVIIWNGTGGGDTGGDWTRTGIGAENAAAAKSGTNGLNTQLTSVGDTCVFDNGSMIDVNGTYTALQFWLRPKATPTRSQFRIFWRDSSNDQVGDPVKITDYVDNLDIDVWQLVTIPIADFGLTGNVQKLVFRFVLVANQRYNFDDIELYPSGGPYRFQALGAANEVCHVKTIVLSATVDTTSWTKDHFLSISGGLDKGLIIRHRDLSTPEVLWSVNIMDNLTLFSRMDVRNEVDYASSIKQYKLIMMPEPASVKLTDSLAIEAVVRDDLSGLNALRAFVQCGKETSA